LEITLDRRIARTDFINTESRDGGRSRQGIDKEWEDRISGIACGSASGYYGIVKIALSKKAILKYCSRILLFAVLVSTSSCSRSLPDSLVVLDPILPVIAPKTAAAISRQGNKTLVLPYEASENLYAVLAAETPGILFLSPLLAPELNRILDSSPDTKVVYAGSFKPIPRKGLYSAGFSSVDAAALAGTILAEQTKGLADTLLCAGIFMIGAEEAAERFVSSYVAGNSGNTPIIEYIATPWSASTANRLKALDIRQAFIAVPGKDAARWAREVFAGSSYVLLESALGGDVDPSLDALIVWDMESSLKALVRSLAVTESASIGGTWKLLGL
jgi:hypothetical protein